MAASPGNAPTVNQHYQIVIHDQRGWPVLVIGRREYGVVDGHGAVLQFENSDYIQLVDSLAWCPAMLEGPNPVMLTSCATCRRPPASLLKRERPTHGLLSVRNARTCVDCGAVTCPRHRRLMGRHWRCIPCSRKSRLLSVIRTLFFKPDQEG